MKTWELIKDFQLKMPHLVKQMQESNHHYDESNLNRHHLEGPVWNHVEMVLLAGVMFKVNLIQNLTLLGHDLGKPGSRMVDDEKKITRFFNHDGLGVFLHLDYLNTLSFLSKEDKVRISSLISIHTYLYTVMRTPGFEKKVTEKFAGEVDLFKDLIQVTRCDALGRFAVDEDRSIWENADTYFSKIIESINPVIPSRETKGEAVILVGTPGSGKSTWVRDNLKGQTVLSRDAVIMDQGMGKNYTDAYHSVDQSVVDEIYNKKVRDAVKSGQDLIFDLTHMTEKSRRRTMSVLPKQMKRKAVVFLVGYDTLMKRNELRGQLEGKYMSKKVMHQMMGNFSAVLPSEGFDEIEYILG